LPATTQESRAAAERSRPILRRYGNAERRIEKPAGVCARTASSGVLLTSAFCVLRSCAVLANGVMHRSNRIESPYPCRTLRMSPSRRKAASRPHLRQRGESSNSGNGALRRHALQPDEIREQSRRDQLLPPV